MNRKYGVEIEVTGISQIAAARAITTAGVACNAEGYNHETRSAWKVVSDGSLRDTTGRGACEVVSPVLNGEDGLIQIKIVCDALIAAGAEANRTCGLHVHVDASGLDARQIRNIVNRYGRYEAEIDGFMPISRRGSNNHFTASVSRFASNDRFMTATTVREMASAMMSRYFKVNLESYLRHGTVEFRQHSGSVNASKIQNWVRFLQGFVSASVASTAASTDANAWFTSINFGRMTRQRQIFGFVAENPTMTRREVESYLVGTGMKPAVVAFWTRKAFIARAAQVAVPMADEGVFTSISAETVAFYQARTAQFAPAVAFEASEMAA